MMSNQDQIEMSSSSNADDPPPLWTLANLFSTKQDDYCSCSDSDVKAKAQLLPGPFVVLQGSPGDGMANTLDSMPMLPIESMSMNNHNNNHTNNHTNANECECEESSNYLEGRRQSRSSVMNSNMNSSLHPLEEMAEEEDDEHEQQHDEQQHDEQHDEHEQHDGEGHCRNLNDEETVAIIARPHTPLLEDDATTTTSTTTMVGRERERSDSFTTGGGLHYPLGEKSPIMQRRVRSLSFNFNSTLMQPQPQPSTTRITTTSSLQHHHHQRQNQNEGPLLPLPLPLPLVHCIKKSTTAEEIASIHKWQKEVSQQELSHLEERNQNVKLLLDRRKRIQEERMRRRSSHHHHRRLVADDAAAADAAAQNHHHDDRNEEHDNGHHHHPRSGSPVALATATSASSSNSSYEEGSHDDEGSGSGSAIISRSTSPPPAAVSTTTTPRTITVSPPIIEQEEEEEENNPINQYMNSLELEMSHRSWYQKDGRLVVFQTLPYRRDYSSSGEVVVHPLVFEKEEEGRMQQQQQQQHERQHWEEDDIVTLAPGTTVMAEEAITLDSRSLKLLHSTAAGINNNDDEQGKQQHHHHRRRRHERSTTTTNNNTLIFLHITSPYPGYILSHIHNYPYLAPGLPTTYTNSTWLWRVTCQPDGAFIRSGLDLVTDHIGTLPYGTLCCVKKKVVNYMGLNRLEIDAFVSNNDGGSSGNNDPSSDDDDTEDDDKGISSAAADAITMKKLSGYISEFLNPLSGQRGNIVEQVSFPIPALYKVIHAEGAIIRSGVELSTGKIGFAPMGSILSIVGRSYSSNPSNNCIERLRLAGGGGWISVTLNREDNEQLVEMIGADESFDPEDPASFHFGQQKKVMAELKADDNNGGSSSPSGGGGGGGSNPYFPRRRSTANLSEIADDDQMSIPDSDGNYVMSMNDAKASSILSSPPRQSSTAAVPTLFQRSGVVGTLGGLVAMDAVRESSSDNHQNENANRCLICLSDERTATIVHGETGHIACCLTCARILKARGDNCPVCRLPIDLVIQQFWA